MDYTFISLDISKYLFFDTIFFCICLAIAWKDMSSHIR